ncbi:MAG: phosphatase PAP2 family protein [Chlamydiales bacterium]
MHNNKEFTWLWLPIIGILCILPFTPFLDLAISRYFFVKDSGFAKNDSFYLFFYYWGDIPGFFIGVTSLILSVWCYFSRTLISYQFTIFLTALVFMIGPGLIIHFALKETINRPRPVNIEEFGGKQTYRPAYAISLSLPTKNRNKSFPSGHVSMAMMFYPLARGAKFRRNMLLYYFLILFCILLTTFVGLSRIAQGGHYFSDVLASILIMYLTTRGVERMLKTKGKWD